MPEKTDWSEIVEKKQWSLNGKIARELTPAEDYWHKVMLARNMLNRFGYREWMRYYIHEDGSLRKIV